MYQSKMDTRLLMEQYRAYEASAMLLEAVAASVTKGLVFLMG